MFKIPEEINSDLVRRTFLKELIEENMELWFINVSSFAFNVIGH